MRIYTAGCAIFFFFLGLVMRAVRAVAPPTTHSFAAIRSAVFSDSPIRHYVHYT